MAAVVIPVTDYLGKSNQEDLDNLLNDLAEDGYKFEEIVVCFDSCKYDFILYFQEKYPGITSLINDGKAFQFTKNANQGLRYCHQKGYDVWLINQDCQLHPNTYTLSTLHTDGLLSVGSSEKPELRKHLLYQPIYKAAFYCIYISKNAMDKIGYMDESFVCLFSDDDYCLRAKLAGLKVEQVNLDIYHKGSHIDTSNQGWRSASGTYGEEDLGIAFAQYQRKWACEGKAHDAIIPWVLENYIWEDRMCCE